MCGIAGIFGLADEAVIKRMVDAQAHRGPDDEGVYLDRENRLCLGHRRLSILDMSLKGRQPMSSADGRFRITYNGEIYNFASLNEELKSDGYVFNSACDTETVLAAYQAWGEACLGRFRGMFAFAVFDRQKRELFLARDRFGIKPLVYTKTGNVFLFASELKALLASGLVDRRVDRQAVWDYLSLGSVPQPRTILRDVYTIPAGCFMRVRIGDAPQIRSYWDIYTATHGKTGRQTGQKEAAAELRRLLEESAKLHMVSDAPVGAFLSGGVDSTAVTALAARHASGPIKTYSIGFEDKHERVNELQWAAEAARHIGTDHKEWLVSASDIKGMFDTLICALDQPCHDGCNIYLVSRIASGGVKAALSGVGGDELFAGYAQFADYNRWQNRLPEGIPAMSGLSRRLPGRLGAGLAYAASGQIERLARPRRFFDERDKARIANPDFRAAFAPRRHQDLYKRRLRASLGHVAQVSYSELTGYLSNTLLRDRDIMGMAHGLEVRPALLDHPLAEFAFSLSDSLKLDRGRGKAVFLDAVEDLVPDAIKKRPKTGFEIPILSWLKQPWKEDALAALNGRSAPLLFTRDFLKAQSRAVRDNKPTLGLWTIVVLSAWMDRCNMDLA